MKLQSIKQHPGLSGGIASLRQTTEFTPGYITDRRAVGPRRRDAINDNVLFLEARLELTSHASVRAWSSTNNSCRAAHLYLFKTRG
jgi:hypothetical protein